MPLAWCRRQGVGAAKIALVSTVFAQTHSAVWVSASILASAGLGGLVAPLAGHLGDVTDRKRLLVASELCGGGVCRAMCTVSQPTVLIALAVLAAVVHAPFDPAAQASVPNVVRASELAWANGTIAGGLKTALVVRRLLQHEVARRFFEAVVEQVRRRHLLSSDHFTVEGTLLEAWASLKSFRSRDEVDRGPGAGAGGGRDPEVSWHGQPRSNATHIRKTILRRDWLGRGTTDRRRSTSAATC